MLQHRCGEVQVSSRQHGSNAWLHNNSTSCPLGLYDALIYLALRLFKLSEPWLKMMSGNNDNFDLSKGMAWPEIVATNILVNVINCSSKHWHYNPSLYHIQSNIPSRLLPTLPSTSSSSFSNTSHCITYWKGLRWLVADSLNHLAHYLLASKLDTLLTSGRVTRLIEVRMLKCLVIRNLMVFGLNDLHATRSKILWGWG